MIVLGGKAQKKIVFVIVEGVSDREALAVLFSELLTHERVIVEFTSGDITTKKGVHPGNIVARLCNIVRQFAKQFFLKHSDFFEVVHIIDTDGAFVDDSVILAACVPKAVYREDCIQVNDPDRIIKHNLQKRENIARLITLLKVWGSVKYSIYFVSCNLDHVLHGEANLREDLKTPCATQFAAKYKGRALEFLRFISAAELQVAATYEASWESIKQDNNSLRRCSNLNIFFSEEAKVVKRHFDH